jgi:hypothetical protein
MNEYDTGQVIRNYKIEAVFLITVAVTVLLIDNYAD